MFTWRPWDSNPSFHALTRSTHSSREVAMITRSSAKNSSQGTPALKSLDKAPSTMIKSSGLRTEPWCTPTPTSNSSLWINLKLLWCIRMKCIPSYCTKRNNSMIYRITWNVFFIHWVARGKYRLSVFYWPPQFILSLLVLMQSSIYNLKTYLYW